MHERLLLVEDDDAVRGMLSTFLRSHKYELLEARNCHQAERLWRETLPDLALLDYSLPDGNALDLLPRFKASNALAPVIIITAFGSIELALQTIQLGAEQFLTKPVDLTTLLVVVQRCLED